MYVKDIFSINYNLLKSKGMKVLLFDFDNTLIKKDQKLVDDTTLSLIKKLSSDFEIMIVSNSVEKGKVSEFAKVCGIKYHIFTMKPFVFRLKKIIKNYNKKEICFIGDQFLTDIYVAKRVGVFSILVDPIHQNEFSLTKINRQIEKIVIKKLNTKYGFERGKYYE